MASVCVAYLLWLVGGWLGLHHFYLKRDKQAFVWWCLPGGYFGLGWVRDLWRIPEYVREANLESGWLVQQQEKQRTTELPPWKMARWGGMLVVGNMFGMLPAMAVPNKEDLGLDLGLLGLLLTPLGCALGIWLVGNIGRWQGSLLRPLVACYLTLPAYLYGLNIISWTTIIGNVLKFIEFPLLIPLILTFRRVRLQARVAADGAGRAGVVRAGGGAGGVRGALPRHVVILRLLQRGGRP